MNKYLVMAFIGCLICGFTNFAFSDQGVTKDKVKIGSLVDLTGPSAVWGTVSKKMGDMWASEVNSKGGIHGRKIEMVYGDNKYRADAALSEVKRLVNFEKVFCFVGGQNTACNLVAAEYAEKAKIPWLFPMTSLSKYNEEVHRYVFNFLPLHESATKVSVDYAVNTWHPKKLGVFYQFDDYGQTELNHIEEQLAKYGMKVAQAEHFKMGQLNVSPEVARLKGAGCEVVIILAHTSMAASFLKDARRIGWDAHFMGCQSCANQNTLKLAGEASEGMVVPVWFNPLDSHNDGMTNLRELLKKYHPGEKMDIRYVTWAYYPALERALELAGPDLTADAIIEACETGFKNYESGFIGPVTYSSTSHKGANSAQVWVVKNGRYHTIPGWEGFLTPKK